MLYKDQHKAHLADLTTMENIVAKLRALPPAKFIEVQDFIEFVFSRLPEKDKVPESEMMVENQRMEFSRLSEPVFAKMWDNDEDSVYDDL